MNKLSISKPYLLLLNRREPFQSVAVFFTKGSILKCEIVQVECILLSWTDLLK